MGTARDRASVCTPSVCGLCSPRTFIDARRLPVLSDARRPGAQRPPALVDGRGGSAANPNHFLEVPSMSFAPELLHACCELAGVIEHAYERLNLAEAARLVLSVTRGLEWVWSGATHKLGLKALTDVTFVSRANGRLSHTPLPHAEALEASRHWPLRTIRTYMYTCY